MNFMTILRRLFGRMDIEEIKRRFDDYTPPMPESDEDYNDDQQQQKETRDHLNRANYTLYRLEMNRSLRRRQY